MSEESGTSGAVALSPGEPGDVLVDAESTGSADSGQAGPTGPTGPTGPAGSTGDGEPTTPTTETVSGTLGPIVASTSGELVLARPVSRPQALPQVSQRPYVRPVEPPVEVRRAPRPDRPERTVDPMTVTSIGRAWRALVEAVGDELDHRQRLWVLEAGAGVRTLFDLPEDAYVVGVDRDPWALERNARLDERVLADVANYRPLATGFDLINSWYVLDGLDDPGLVLERFAQWTGEQGLVVLAVGNLRSPRGVVRRLLGRTKLRRAVTLAALRRHFTRHGFSPVLQVYFEDADQIEQRRRFRITKGRWTAVQLIVRILSLGLLDAARTDVIVVFRRDR